VPSSAFFDTNLLLYLFDVGEPAKSEAARRVFGGTQPGEWLQFNEVSLACGTYRFTARVNGSVGNDFWVITNSTVGGVGAPVVSAAVDRFGGLDIVIANAGISIGMDTAASTGNDVAQTGTDGYAIPIDKALEIVDQIDDGNDSATVHVGVGYDIIHEHPNCDGAALGQTSYQDFLIFTLPEMTGTSYADVLMKM
jgi:hypothetical protein